MVPDHVLIIGFGAPGRPEDVMPFLEKVTEGRRIPPARLMEVAHHYEVIGGSSPYNNHVFGFAENLRRSLRQEGNHLPVFCGMRNWDPFLRQTLEEIRDAGLSRGLAVILAPHQSIASCRRYKDSLNEAIRELEFDTVRYEYLPAWNEDELYIEALSEVTRQVWAQARDESGDESVPLFFSAHSIPVSMLGECTECDYAAQVEATSRAVARTLEAVDWKIVYQSRSGRPQEPWLEPDILSSLDALAGKHSSVVVVPAGFLCDNAEVLYDLDVEARQRAEKLGIRFFRASTVLHHPFMVRLFSRKILHLSSQPQPEA